MSYQRPIRLTDIEELDARIADLEIDYRCAIRDGYDDYATHILSALQDLKKHRTVNSEIQSANPLRTRTVNRRRA